MLQTLELGVWQLFSNSHAAYGDVGCLDGLAARMPELRRLCIYGNCELHAPLSLPQLEVLHVVVDDPVTGLNGGAPNMLTVSSLLSSVFPNLRELYIDLEIDDDDACYSVPELLLSEDLFPELKTFELAGRFQSGDKQRLSDAPSLKDRDVRLQLDAVSDGID